MTRITIVNINLSPRTQGGCRKIAQRLTQLTTEAGSTGGSDLETNIVGWAQIVAEGGLPKRANAVVLGPNETPFPAYPDAFDTFLSWVRGRRGLTLGICGGHQALALAHGAPVGPVHRVPAARHSYAGMPKIKGDKQVRLLGEWDPLLDGLDSELRVYCSHVDEVKELPPGFRLLAIGDPCNIQVFKADRRPLYGVQFHPEHVLEGKGDAGGRLLRNFLRMAGAR